MAKSGRERETSFYFLLGLNLLSNALPRRSVGFAHARKSGHISDRWKLRANL